MKYTLHLSLFLSMSFYFSVHAQISPSDNKDNIKQAINTLCQSLAGKQKDINYRDYPGIYFTKTFYHLTDFKLNDTLYAKSITDAMIYKRYKMYSKLIDGRDDITSDCLEPQETKDWHYVQTTLFASIYHNPTWVFPKDITKLYSQLKFEHDFLGTMVALDNIYYLKQLNWNNVPLNIQTELLKLADELGRNAYEKYIKDKPWGYQKLAALTAIRKNHLNLAADVNDNDILAYIKNNVFNVLSFENDQIEESVVKTYGYNKIEIYNEANALILLCTRVNK